MEFDNTSVILPLPTDELINENEAFLRVTFPEKYRELIKEYNGCSPKDYRGVFLAENNHEYVIDRLLCQVPNPKEIELGVYDINVVLAQIEERLTDEEHADELGNDVVPIAVLFAGNFLCLDFRKGGDNPTVVVWDHERSDDWKPVFYHVANSFDEFMKIVK